MSTLAAQVFVPSVGQGVYLTEGEHYGYALKTALVLQAGLEAGGATLTHRQGIWEGAQGPVVEDVYTVLVYTQLNQMCAEEVLAEVVNRIKAELKQESVLVTINDIPYFY